MKPGDRHENADPAVEAELDRLSNMPIAALRKRYSELFRADPPQAFGPDLLRRSIAYRIQEKAYGGLSTEHQRLLRQLVKAATGTKPGGKLELPRRIKPGSELVRTWNGRTYRVVAMAEGFAYEGRTFPNLSEIASLITSVKWNGPRFFGLRTKAAETADLEPNSPRKARRPSILPRSNHGRLRPPPPNRTSKGGADAR